MRVASSVGMFSTDNDTFRQPVGNGNDNFWHSNCAKAQSARMTDGAMLPADYSTWLAELKQRIQTA